jgi:hypothetical protein
MEYIATFTSSQFVSCIESIKKEVKKKTRIKVRNSATHRAVSNVLIVRLDATSFCTLIRRKGACASHQHKHWGFDVRKICGALPRCARENVRRKKST